MIPVMAKVAAQCYLGVLAIDEIQNLSEAKSGGSDKMLNFFVRLVNTIGLPVIMIGTFKAASLFSDQFRNGRRGSGQGCKVVERMKFDDEWRLLIEGIWKYQWVKKPAPLSEEIEQAIYEESQGIIDLAVKLFMLAQWSAISDGTEKITPGVIHKVAKESLRLVQPVIKALRDKNFELLSKFDDVYLPDSQVNEYYLKGLSEVEAQKRLDHLRRQQKEAEDRETGTRIAYVASWLAQAGFAPKLARTTAEKAVSIGEEKDLQTLCQEAIQLLLNNENKNSKNSDAKQKVISFKKNNKSILQIVKRGREQKKPPYEALKEAGLIKSPQELGII